MAIDFSSIDTTPATTAASVASSSATIASTNTVSSDSFLKLLVTQMQNQDPLNPMDNAQVTSQMAQINTVNGIDTLNTTVQGLNSQFLQLQSLTGASLVGKDVWVSGDSLNPNTTGSQQGAFNLSGSASAVQLDVMDSTGKVVETEQLGTQTSGRHEFTYKPTDSSASTTGMTFKITATNGATPVTSTNLMLDHVDSIGLDGNTLTLSLTQSGDTPYTSVLAVD